jgi:protein-L-isoaspartate(D-aspartate) O-methyltransferase
MDNPRHQMVQHQLHRRGIKNKEVLEAMEKVPRHLFVKKEFQDFAYDDRPLPIGYNQTISQPYIVAYMTDRLNVSHHQTVLEIGTGCGYQTAILSELAGNVYSLERIPELAESAQQRLHKLGYNNVDVIQGNGWNGYKKKAPYDRIIVTAGANKIPKSLNEQLANGGIMIIPVGRMTFNQFLKIVRKDSSGHISTETTLPVRFVKLKKN